jgi:hypothetical protein
VFPSSRAIREKVTVLIHFMLQIIKENRLRSMLVLASSTAAAASQAGILLLLNQGLTSAPTDEVSTTTPTLAISLALILTVIAAWLQFASSRLVMAIWIARGNQNLFRIDIASQQLFAWVRSVTSEQRDKEVNRHSLQILVSLRSLNIRQGLAVRAAFGIATGAMSLAGLVLGALILNAPITVVLLVSALLVVLPLTLRHGARMVSNEREFRLYSARSSSSFKSLVHERLSKYVTGEQSSFTDEPNHLRMNRALTHRLTTPNWNRVIAVTVLVGSLPLLLAVGLMLGYQLPPTGTLVVLLIAILAALSQVASLSGLITVLGRFLDTITGFESSLVRIKAIKTTHDLAHVAEKLWAISGGSQDNDDV